MKNLLFAGVLLLLIGCGADGNKKENYKFLVGTFTNDMGWVKGKGEGIYIIEVDPTSDSLKIVQTIKGIENPAYLASNEDGSQIYVSCEIVDTINNYPSRVCHLERDTSGLYAKTQEGGTYGKSACHIAVNSTRSMYAVANYNEGKLAYGSLTPSGDLELNIKNRVLNGSSINPTRQGASHLHMTKFFDNDKKLIVTDLGADSLRIFSIINNELSPAPSFSIATDPGDGPRHLDITKDNKYIYVVNELSNSITTYEYYTASNTMRKSSKTTTLPEGFTQTNTTSHVLLSPNEKFIYAANRGHNSIAVFSRGEKGVLTSIGHYPTEGEVPRNFTITKDGKYLIAGNQNSDSVILYAIGRDGKLTKSNKYSLPTPVCFVEVK